MPEEKVVEVKREDIQIAAKESVRKKGWLPGIFRTIIHGAMEKLKKLIREYDLPPKPAPKVDIDLYNDMVKLHKAINKEKDAAIETCYMFCLHRDQRGCQRVLLFVINLS